MCLSIAFYKHSQENTKDLLKRDPKLVFSCEYCKIFKNSFFYRNLPVAAFGSQSVSLSKMQKFKEFNYSGQLYSYPEKNYSKNTDNSLDECRRLQTNVDECRQMQTSADKSKKFSLIPEKVTHDAILLLLQFCNSRPHRYASFQFCSFICDYCSLQCSHSSHQ